MAPRASGMIPPPKKGPTPDRQKKEPAPPGTNTATTERNRPGALKPRLLGSLSITFTRVVYIFERVSYSRQLKTRTDYGPGRPVHRKLSELSSRPRPHYRPKAYPSRDHTSLSIHRW